MRDVIGSKGIFCNYSGPNGACSKTYSSAAPRGLNRLPLEDADEAVK